MISSGANKVHNVIYDQRDSVCIGERKIRNIHFENIDRSKKDLIDSIDFSNYVKYIYFSEGANR